MRPTRRIIIEWIPIKFKKRLFELRQDRWNELLALAAPNTDLGRGRTTSSMIPNLGQHQLEIELTKRFNRKHCIFTNCASDALDITVQALGYKDWHVPSYTWYSPVSAIKKSGATPHFLDVNLSDRCVQYSDFNPDLPCLVPHVDGRVAPPPPGDSCPFILEDAAQSPLSPGNNFGDAIILSFGSSKKLGLLGQGGCILTDRDDLAKQLKILSVFGLDSERDLVAPGYKSFLDPFNALCTLEMLHWYDDVKIQQRIADIITHYNDCANLDHPPYLERYTIQVENREQFRENAEELKIETRVWFKDHAARTSLFKVQNLGNLPNSDKLCKTSVDVPMNELLSDSEVERVGSLLKKAPLLKY